MAEDHGRAEGKIPTNLRLLFLLEEVAQAGTPRSPASLAEALELPKATVHRLLATAEEEGFVQRDLDGRSFGPGRRMRHLAAQTMSSQRLRTERLLVMKALAEEVGETCNLAVPGRYGMLYIDRVETHWPLRIQLPVGTQVPFHCTASGKLFLASLRPEKVARLLDLGLPLEARTERTLTDPDQLHSEFAAIRARDYGTDDEEFMDGMAAISVPVRDVSGRLLSTLAIHAPIQRNGLRDLIAHFPRLRAAADKLERLIND